LGPEPGIFSTGALGSRERYAMYDVIVPVLFASGKQVSDAPASAA
jgi:hypothetical protein